MKKLLLASLCFLLLCASQLYAQNRTVTGTVTSKDDGLPLPGVTVQVVGTKIGTQTNANGKFVVNAPASARSLTFSFIGYQSQTVAIGSGAVSVVLVSTTNQLNEVVVAAGGLAVTRASQGYTSTTVKAQEITQGKATNVAAALSGKVAGLQVNVVSSGVNPNVRLVLRGNRSLLGNNQALVVIDNVIVPSSLLANLNPEDIEDIQVYNGAGAAALYGSDASNGALLITTKKGKRGSSTVRVSNTTQWEQVSFFPKLQTSFGSGSSNDVQEYVTYENQQYGPAFNGAPVVIGKPIQSGAVLTVPYAATNAKNDFWNTGIGNQTDFSVSSGDEKSTSYISGQYFTQSGTTPMDKYNRASVRANGTRDLGNGVSLTYNTNYIQNRYNTTSATSNMYDQILNTPAHVPLTELSDWRNNPFASPDGYYNEYYDNPYFSLEANRARTRNDYLSGVIELKWAPISYLSFTGRTGLTTQNQSYKNTSEKYVLSPYTKSIGTAATKTNDRVGGVTDGSSYSTQLNADLFGTFNKKYNDLNVNFTAGVALRNNASKSQNVSASGLVQNGLFNVDQRFTANVTGGESNAVTRQIGAYGTLALGYKGFLTLNLTGRNDWLSVLAPENRSFFYPSANVAFIPTEAFDWMKNSKVVNNLKIRANVSKVGQANIGAYALQTTFSQASGYPFATGPGYGLDGRIVSVNLRPEITKGAEAGFDADWLDNRISTSFTYYYTTTTNQTVPTGVSLATGYSSYLVNTGEMINKGIESSITVTAFKNADWQINLGGNYTYLQNMVKSISSDLSRVALSTGGTAQVYAIAGQPYPVLLGSDYARDNQGRIIVDPVTGYPSANPSQVMLGNTNPKHRLGLNTEVRYKSFRLTALAEYRTGFVIYNNGASTYDFSGSSLRTVYYNRERFVMPNSSYLDPATNSYVANTNVTVADGGAGFFADNNRNMNVASNYVYSGASWKLREVSLSYDLPKNVLGKQKYVKGATISVQGRNLALWMPKSNIYTDPEFNFSEGNAIGLTTLGQTPPTRFYSATLSLTF